MFIFLYNALNGSSLLIKSCVVSFNDVFNILIIENLVSITDCLNISLLGLIYYSIMFLMYLFVKRLIVLFYLEEIWKNIITNLHFNYGYFVRFNSYLFIKLNFIILFIIYLWSYYYLTIFLILVFSLYHLILTLKTISFQIQYYNINLGYFILRIYRFVKKTTHYCLECLKAYKVSVNSWLYKVFKYMFYISIMLYLISENSSSTINLLLVTPLSAAEEALELDREYDRLRVKARENRLKKKQLRSVKTGIRVKLEKGSTVNDLNNKNKSLKLRITGVNLDKEATNHKGNIEKLFYALTRSKRFINFSKVKSVFIHYNNDGEIIPLHLGIPMSNQTTFEDYYSKLYPFMKEHWKEGYLTTYSDDFIVTLYNLDIINKNLNITKAGVTRRSYSTKVCGNTIVELTDPQTVQQAQPVKNKVPSIKPLEIPNTGVKPFCSMDIETIILNKDTNEHLPIAISTHSQDFSKLFIIDLALFKKNQDKAIKKLFNEYLEFMISLKKDYVIFAHNLGSYDGYFIYKYMIKLVKDKNDLDCLVDSSNKFISITHLNKYKFEGKEIKTQLVWKDSLRIFPGSLESLCKQFNVEGKLSKYKPEYNMLSLFDNPELLEEFKNYSMQDSVALYNALKNAQNLDYQEYSIDICEIVSTASLSFKIYRSHFLHDEIPLLTKFEESFIRESYLGGATDYYKAKGENLRCYDVNSLYPSAMKKELPYKVKAKHSDLSFVNVKDFKGFVLAKVTSPEYIKNPIVALKHEGKTIYPLGSWTGVYYADYLAKAQEYGYKIELISGIEFEYKRLFDEYIDHFYEIKKNSTGSLRYLAKLKLNSLYGMFGRKNESLEVFNVRNKDINNYLAVKVVKNIIDFNNGYSTLICEKGLDSKTIKELNLKIHTNVSDNYSPTFANVAIASAITSEAQMIMMDYKNHPDFEVYYTDTDSLFTDKPIPEYLVGKALGYMKNETLDKYGVETIAMATFVGLKKYGLRVIDKEGLIKDSSTFAGVPKDSLTFDEVNDIHNGTPLVRNLKDRFNKSFNTLNIKTQSNVKLEISNKRDKELVNNEYIPKTVNLLGKQEFDSKLVAKLVNRYNKNKKNYPLI